MERVLSMKRSYNLSPYNQIEIFDSFISLPEDAALNNTLVGKIRLLQMIESERSFKKYLKLESTLDGLELDQAIENLNKSRDATMEEIKSLMTKKE